MCPRDSFGGTVNVDIDLGVSSELPVFLYPCQIETRLFEGRLLKVRIFPDQLAISSLKRELSKNELEDAKLFHAAKPSDRTAIWRRLSQAYGMNRAAWIVRQSEAGKHKKLKARQDSDTPCLSILPEFFMVTVHLDNGGVIRKWSRVPDSLAVISVDENGIFGKGAEWISDFEVAKKKGLAFEFRIPNGVTEIRKLTAVGVRREDAKEQLLELLEAHHYTTSAGVVKYGTLTNNSEQGGSAHSSKESPDARFDQEFGTVAKVDRESAAANLAVALGLGSSGEQLFSRWQHGRETSGCYTGELQKALWPVTGGYFLRTFLRGAMTAGNQSKVEKTFEKYVRPQGLLPSLRIGNLPYGILPVTSFSEWERTPLDSQHLTKSKDEQNAWAVFDEALWSVLKKFSDQWRVAANDAEKVPRIGATGDSRDPDEELAAILAMSANSQEFALRPYVDDRLIGWYLKQFHSSLFPWLKDLPEGINWAKEWIQTWKEVRRGLESFLRELEVKPSVINSSRMATNAAWGDTDLLDMPLTHSRTEPNDKPDHYIPILERLGADAPKDASGTLLYALLRRALMLERGAKPWKFRRQDSEDTEKTILEFFNQAKTAEEIASRIMDDPGHNRTGPRTYGVRRSLGEKILYARDLLPAKKFTELAQIDSIKGVGEDTLQDIVYSFSARLESFDFEAALKGVFDVLTYRLDAWISAMANKRLESMRQSKPEGIVVGAYGFVEHLSLSGTEKYAPGGYIHAPSANQAITAALLKSGFLSQSKDPKSNEHPYSINLSSERIRRALQVMQGVREGQELGALLGFQFERELHDLNVEKYKDEFRNAFPLRVTESETTNGDSAVARSVVNGMAVIEEFEKYIDPLEFFNEKVLLGLETESAEATVLAGMINRLRDTLDAVSDLLVHEGVYQTVCGNYERSGAAMDAAAGNGPIPEIESITVPFGSLSMSHRICVLFDADYQQFDPQYVRENLEPWLATWVSKVLGNPNDYGCCVEYSRVAANGRDVEKNRKVVRLDELGMGPLDFLYASANRPGAGATEIEMRVKDLLRTSPDGLIEQVWVAADGLETASNADGSRIAPALLRIDFGNFETNAYKPEAGNGYTKSMAGAMELASHVLQTLSQATRLKPENLCAPQDAVKFPMSDSDYKELRGRADSAFQLLVDAVTTVRGAVEPLYLAERFGKVFNAVGELLASPEKFRKRDPASSHADVISTEIIALFGTRLEGLEFDANALRAIIADSINSSPTFEKALTEARPVLLGALESFMKERLASALDATSAVNAGSLATTARDGADLGDAVAAVVAEVSVSTMSARDRLSRFGIPVDRTGSVTSESMQAVLDAAMGRQKKTFSLLASAQKASEPGQQGEDETARQTDHAIELLVKAIKAMLGENFIVLPSFELPQRSNFSAACNDQTGVLAGQSASRVYLWLQQAAQTHRGAQSLEDMLLLLDACSDAGHLSPKVVQLPYQSSTLLQWQALSNKELGISSEADATLIQREADIRAKRPALSTSLAIFSESATPSARVCGVVAEQFTEMMPLGVIDTALAVNADTPNQQPPNCCLLGVPGTRQKNGRWTPKALEAIVSDTLELAKIRAVDLDALPDMKGLLPAVYLPLSQEQDSFDEKEMQLERLRELEMFSPFFK